MPFQKPDDLCAHSGCPERSNGVGICDYRRRVEILLDAGLEPEAAARASHAVVAPTPAQPVDQEALAVAREDFTAWLAPRVAAATVGRAADPPAAPTREAVLRMNAEAGMADHGHGLLEVPGELVLDVDGVPLEVGLSVHVPMTTTEPSIATATLLRLGLTAADVPNLAVI